MTIDELPETKRYTGARVSSELEMLGTKLPGKELYYQVGEMI